MARTKGAVSRFNKSHIESTSYEGSTISVGQKKLERRQFAGYTGQYIRSRFCKQDFESLNPDHQKAVVLYWDAVLAAEHLSMSSGEYVGHNHIVYAPDIRVLDFFAEDKTYDIPQDNGERLEAVEWQTE